MISVLTFLFVLVCIMLLAIILLQSSKGGGLGSAISGQSMNDAFGGGGADKLLVRTTSILAVIFMVLALVISRLPHPGSSVSVSSESNSIMAEDEAKKEAINNKPIELNEESNE